MAFGCRLRHEALSIVVLTSRPVYHVSSFEFLPFVEPVCSVWYRLKSPGDTTSELICNRERESERQTDRERQRQRDRER